jgi:hypothetical protein
VQREWWGGQRGWRRGMRTSRWNKLALGSRRVGVLI